MGSAFVVKTSLDKQRGKRVNQLKAQTRHERIKEITWKLAEILTAEERIRDRKQLNIALCEMAVFDHLVESQTQVVSPPTTMTLVNRPALPLPMFHGEIAAWESWKAVWATYNDDVSLSEKQKYQYLRGCFKKKAADAVS